MAQNAQIDINFKEESVESEKYLDFVNKFKTKKTTDDCYTPPAVYDAIKKWVIDEYGLEDYDVLRPFHPDGDYQAEKYTEKTVVIDNPPFSILAEIVRFYLKNNVKYFLFAPSLTMFSKIDQCHIVTKSTIEYDNEAIVSTGFVTNLDDNRVRTAPDLKMRIEKAVVEVRKTKKLDKYVYPDTLITAARIHKIADIDFAVGRNEISESISVLDSQRRFKKTIFGKGFFVSESKAAELKSAELKSAELKSAEELIVWELSEREQNIVKNLGGGNASKKNSKKKH